MPSFTPAAATDLQRVSDTLTLLRPRWTVWVLTTLNAHGPARFTELRRRLPHVSEQSLLRRLRALDSDGLIDKRAEPRGHLSYVHYTLTDSGRELLPACTALTRWAQTQLTDRAGRADDVTEPAEHAERAVYLLAKRDVTAIMWALKMQGTASARELAQAAGRRVYDTLRPLVRDNLVAEAGPRTTTGPQQYALSPASRALGPVYLALSDWGAGTAGSSALRAVWLPAPPAMPVVSHAGAAHPTASPPPGPRRRAPQPAWRSSELFSHPYRRTVTSFSGELDR
ncbi:winged helix-turn-helix transcriptional regulator [Streptomyces sp. NPDC050085]|uniref:winged helix-turn-helix transcriptional regulator n=1 Tax=Streptomyces sp. NPDC050085 TaxID=3365600 RepID=UPI00379FC118